MADIISDMDTCKKQAMSSIENMSAVSEETAASTEEVSASTQEQPAYIEEPDTATDKLNDLAGKHIFLIEKYRL